MFSKIFSYEFKYWLSKPSTYIYAFVIISIAFISFIGTGGYFDGSSARKYAVKLMNSPHELNFILQYFGKMLLFLLPAIIGAGIYRDSQSQSHHIMYSFPIEKKSYLWGKFISAFSVVLLITLGVGISFIVGEFILGTNNPKIGAFNILGYLSAFGWFIIPNLFIYGLLVFMVVASTREIYAGFVTVIILFLVQILTENLFASSPFLVALLDPFAQSAVTYETSQWTLADKNAELIPTLGVVLYNRLLWLVMVLLVGLGFYNKFSFSHEPMISASLGRNKSNKKPSTRLRQESGSIQLSSVEYDHSLGQNIKRMFQLAKFDFLYIVKNWGFVFLTFFGVLAIVFALNRMTNAGDFTLYPFTRIMLAIPLFFYSIIIILITFLYSGMLVHRARTARVDQLVDVSAIPNWTFLGGKLIAILQVQLLLLLVMMLSAIGIQIYQGFYQFEIGLYLYQLFVLTFPLLAIWAFASLFIHSLIPNVYLGVFTLLLGWAGKDQLSQININTQLLEFNKAPNLTYSDFNGFGTELPAYVLIESYWFVIGIILLMLTYLIWQRGSVFSMKERWDMARSRFSKRIGIAGIAALLLATLLGFKIYQGEQDIYFSKIKQKKVLANVKEKFKQYKDEAQPKITAVKLNIDIHPTDHSFKASGTYKLENKSDQVIDKILIKTGFDEITKYVLSRSSNIIQQDTIMQYTAHQLATPLAPNDSMSLYFEVENRANTIFERNSSILENGTYIKNDAFPKLGYFWLKQASNPNDSLQVAESMYAGDSDLIDFQATISTSEDQKVLSAGYLKKEWEENNRHYYHYQSDEKIKFNFAFHSGAFEEMTQQHKGVGIKVWHHPEHDFNNEKMIKGIKAAYDYNTQYFSTYPFNEISIVEIPLTEESFAATLMANIVPTSELQFVIKSQDEKDKIDLAFYVMAHELTHQWFGNFMMPANADGAKMLAESLTEYISTRIYEKHKGKEQALKFLKIQRKRYLKGRSKAYSVEQPLNMVKSSQDYIAYGKGAITFNTLQHYWGEENLNQCLSDFLRKYPSSQGQFPTSLDFVKHLKMSLPTDLHYLVNDMIENITFYDNKINQVDTKNKNNQHHVQIDFEVNKHTDDKEETPLPLNDYIEIACYNSAGEQIHLEKTKITQSQNTLNLKLQEAPTKVIIDPNLLTIEKNIDDNVFE